MNNNDRVEKPDQESREKESNGSPAYPFKDSEVFKVFKYLKTKSYKKDLILYSYIYNFITEKKIDRGLPKAEYFDFVRKNYNTKVKDTKPQANANSSRRTELLENIYAEYLKTGSE